MNADRWDRLGELFVAALDRPPAERDLLIAQQCADDQALLSDVSSLIAAAERSSDFLTSNALDRLAKSIATDGWSLRPGEHIGAYTVDRLLGVGGSGAVWRARDERLGRDVAIKVLLPHASSDPDHLRRFAEEAR